MKKIISLIICVISLIVAYIIDINIDMPIWAKLLMYLVPYLIAGYSTIIEAIKNILHGDFFDENFLMCIATIGALAIAFLPGAKEEFLEAVFVMFFFQIGEIFEEKAEEKSRKSIEDLMDIRPDIAFLEQNGNIIEVKPTDVIIGDIIVIRPGERIPLDGIIIEGKSSINTVAITGESLPRNVDVEDDVISGCLNLTGLLRVKVTKLFGESTVSKILELVEKSSENKAKSENFITKFSKIYTPIVVLLALVLAFIPPLFSNNYFDNFSSWLNRSLTFLIVSCPCALVISVPLSFFGGIGGASKKGILIKGSNYMETLSKIDTIVFDKTGTLTKGVFEVTAIHPEKCDENHLLHYAAHVERYSTHPIALSLRQAYENEDDLCEIKDVTEYAGKGIKALVNNHEVYVGNNKLMEEINISYKKCNHVGTIVHVVIDMEYMGHIVISDQIKEESKDAILALKQRNIKTVMLTGDHQNVASNVAETLNIDEFHAELFPNDKVYELTNLIEKNHKVAFVGDGINDAPVLARADIGIAMGAMGSDAAIEAADVVLMDDNISKIITSIDISKRTLCIVKQNVFFALLVKFVVLILAVFGLAPMWLAVFADVGVTVIAILNATRALNYSSSNSK